ncbi:unnamed protein product [Rotaria magnacalcarata]
MREVFLVSNKHKFHNWDKVFPLPYQNLHVYETFGMHPKFLPERDLHLKLSHLESIFRNKFHPASGRHIVGVGETGLDETSKFSLDYQKSAFEKQVILAKDLNLPLVLHCRGHSLFSSMLDCIDSILSPSHAVQWHCIKSDSDLEVIDRFMSVFPNSVVSLNGAIIEILHTRILCQIIFKRKRTFILSMFDSNHAVSSKLKCLAGNKNFKFDILFVRLLLSFTKQRSLVYLPIRSRLVHKTRTHL